MGSACSPARIATRWCAASCHDPTQAVTAVTRIHSALEAMERNPNETLLLQSLLLDLPSL